MYSPYITNISPRLRKTPPATTMSQMITSSPLNNSLMLGIICMGNRKTRIQKLQEGDHEHLLMLEHMAYTFRRNPKPHHLSGMFILTYQLFPPNQLGCPILADTLNEHFAKFAKSYGFDEYDRRLVFQHFCDWGIKSERIKLDGKDTKFYLVNPLHILEE